MWFLLYNIGTQGYFLLVKLAALFSDKALDFVKGRVDLLPRIAQQLEGKNEKRIWFHFASLGEFEQGRPVMLRLRSQYPDYRFFVTFFSPSGYNIKKQDELCDYVFYLPNDSATHAAEFLDLVQPQMVFFVKYEFWLHYINAIRQRNIPLFLLSAVFRESQLFFHPLAGSFFAGFLRKFTAIFVQNEESLLLARHLNLNEAHFSGDTRFDRVIQTITAAESIPQLEAFKSGHRIIIAGSSWPREEQWLQQWWVKHQPAGVKLIIAPHDVSVAHIQQIQNLFPEALLFSKISDHLMAKVLIIDSIGLLARAYRYGDIAIVGGAFGKGLHNILEAAAFGLPVVFGPKHNKFWEAAELCKAGGAFEVHAYNELEHTLNVLGRFDTHYQQASDVCKRFVLSQTGATDSVLRVVNRLAALH